MDKTEITEKELKLIEEIAQNGGITQRELSRISGISLGMVNMTLKKLIKRGYVKARGMNKRSLEYVLTPKGFSEKAKKSYRYFRSTLSSLKKMKEKIQSLILAQYSKGARNFIILGEGELADIVEMSFRGFPFDDVRYRRVKRGRQTEKRGWVVLAAEEKYRNNFKSKHWIDVLDELAK